MTTLPRCVLFDMDDTLVVTRQVKWQQHKYVAKHAYGIDLTDEKLAQHWGEPFAQMLGHLYENSASTEDMIAEYRKLHGRFPKLEQPGAVALTKRLLARGAVVGVVTSMLGEVSRPDLVRLGFPIDQFLTVQGSDDCEFAKPDPRVFTPIIDRLAAMGISEDQTVYVGDALIDQEAAEGAGIGFIGVSTGLAKPSAFPSGTPVFGSLEAAGELL